LRRVLGCGKLLTSSKIDLKETKIARISAREAGYTFGRRAGYSNPNEPYGYQSDDAFGDAEPGQLQYARGYRQGYADGQAKHAAKLAA